MMLRLSHLALFVCSIGLALASAVPTLSGSAVTFYSGTYPRATFLSDGSIIGSVTQVVSGANVLTVVRSTDKGATWAHWGEIAREVGDVDNTYLLQLSSGRVLAAYREHTKGTSGETIYRITVSYSDNSGVSWLWLSTPDLIDGGSLGIWEPFMRLSTTGVLQLYYSRELASNDQDSWMRTSTDGGATWSAAATISGANLITRDGMLGVVNTGGKNLIAVFESYATGSGGNGLSTIVSISSSDDGATWGNRKTVYTPTTSGANAGAPQIVQVGSALVVSFMTNEDDVGPTPWTSYATTKIVTSSDGGSTWGNKLTVGPQTSVWPGMLSLDTSSLLVLFDHGGSKAQKVTVANSQTTIQVDPLTLSDSATQASS